MKKLSLPFIVALVGSVSLFAQNAAEDIDYEKARQLFERQKSGQTLTADERAYVARAMASKGGKRAEQPSPGKSAAPGGDIDWEKARGLYQREQKGEKLTSDEQAYLNRAKASRGGNSGGKPGGAAPNQRKAPEHLPPLTDLSGSERYEGEDGGLTAAARTSRRTHTRRPRRRRSLASSRSVRMASLPRMGRLSSSRSACRTRRRSFHFSKPRPMRRL